ncbi:YdbH domain-containing protein [Lysobacter sp. GX 14042]|uniref:YdbH domain-containing protein n=1 Tax=Lysobacter sp. GX 14042 TaxID=2907155 RepID=UPI001F200497|nr:YdbH domain-containing protein [Lysobacter sp. GX 14042]MCE7032429.1 YdbH domain-containing protein [Lysobacter sp. GX 14042]
MPRPILPAPSIRRRAAALALAAWLVCGAAWGRNAEARIERIETAAATLADVRVSLAWSEAAGYGQLRLRADRLDTVPGYTLRQLDWRCELRSRSGGQWRCAGPVRSSGGGMDLAVSLDDGDLEALLEGGGTRASLVRLESAPDTWEIDLAGVPLAWLQQLLAQAWPEGRLTAGSAGADLRLHTPEDRPVELAGTLAVADAGFDSEDGRFAGEELVARLELQATFGEQPAFSIDGTLSGGGLLLGPAYLALEDRDIGLAIQAADGPGGWSLPAWRWDDPGILQVQGSARLPAAAGPDLALEFDVPALGPLGRHYLDGLLALAGLGGMRLEGAAGGSLMLADGALEQAWLRLDSVDVADGAGRFAFDAVDGGLRFSAGAPVQDSLAWDSGRLHAIALGPTRLPLYSAGGELWLATPATLDLLGGQARLDMFRLRPPRAGEPLELGFGLALEALDVGALAAALDWPAFTGELSGSIPDARYVDGRLELAGGMEMSLFGGEVRASGLSMERPFGVAPTLNADVRLADIDLAALTGAFEIGGMTGRLDGRIDGLRLLDWRPVAFDAWLVTDPSHRERQRISQRAVQDISSVGDASLVGSLQGRLIGLFDDFGYSRLGIGCVLRDEVCSMRGLRPAVNDGFVIVAGSGLPHLSVVGYNRRVDWPTLVERLAGLGKGDVKPVVE